MKNLNLMSKRKNKCEICGYNNKSGLQVHHIIPRTDVNCTNDPFNLCVLCANCHNKVHRSDLNIIGVFPSTDPSGVSLIYELNGEKNVDVEDPYFTPKPKVMKIPENYYGREDGETVGDEQETDSTE